MKLNNKEQNIILKNDTVYRIEYKSAYSRGVMIIDTKFYDKVSKKLVKALKDCTILSMLEQRKEEAI